MQFGLSQLLWSLGSAGTLIVAMRLTKVGVWLLLRPGGWAVVVVAVLVFFKAVDQGAVPEAAVRALVAAPQPEGPVLPGRAMLPPPVRP